VVGVADGASVWLAVGVVVGETLGSPVGASVGVAEGVEFGALGVPVFAGVDVQAASARAISAAVSARLFIS
jgi:hypothetical protein